VEAAKSETLIQPGMSLVLGPFGTKVSKAIRLPGLGRSNHKSSLEGTVPIVGPQD
jgi:hypothetical protein